MTEDAPDSASMPDELRAEAERIDALYRAKAEAELADVFGTDCAVMWHGDALAGVLVVKGEPGPEDVAAGFALAGPDGEAIAKALDALAADPTRCALCSRAISTAAEGRARALRVAIEAVDPDTIIALDGEAVADVAEALGAESLMFGAPRVVGGRTVLAVDGFAASLDDETRKRVVWTQLRTLASRDG